jgi:hypothetical protein
MALEIGSDYKKNKEKLRELIKQGKIKTSEIPELIAREEKRGHACYFCLEKIPGTVVVLEEKKIIDHRPCESKYFIDRDCLQLAKEGKPEHKPKKYYN